MVTLESALKDAIKNGVSAAVAIEIQDIVLKETRRALRDHEERIARIIRAAVADAIEEMFS